MLFKKKMRVHRFSVWRLATLKISHPLSKLSINSCRAWQPMRSLYEKRKRARQIDKDVKVWQKERAIWLKIVLSGLTVGPLSPLFPLSPVGPATPCKIKTSIIQAWHCVQEFELSSTLSSNLASNKLNINELRTNNRTDLIISATLQRFHNHSNLNVLILHDDEVRMGRRAWSLCLVKHNVKWKWKVAGACEGRGKKGQGQRSALPVGLVALQDPVDLEVPSVTAGIKTQLGDLSKLHKAFLDF